MHAPTARAFVTGGAKTQARIEIEIEIASGAHVARRTRKLLPRPLQIGGFTPSRSGFPSFMIRHSELDETVVVPPCTRQPMASAQPETRASGRQVLIVEDSEIFRNLLKYGLQSRYPGVRILEAANVAEGEALARRHVPAVILMDVQLPDGNGLDLTQTLKGDIPGVHVVICTAHDLPEHREAAVRCGAAHFVSKDRLAEVGFMELVGELLGEGNRERAATPGSPEGF